eukprot:1506220-Pleurochrysis_carterae.AAC.1
MQAYMRLSSASDQSLLPQVAQLRSIASSNTSSAAQTRRSRSFASLQVAIRQPYLAVSALLSIPLLARADSRLPHSHVRLLTHFRTHLPPFSHEKRANLLPPCPPLPIPDSQLRRARPAPPRHAAGAWRLPHDARARAHQGQGRRRLAL